MPKVLYEKRDRIAYVTINRPEAKNAIDPDDPRAAVGGVGGLPRRRVGRRGDPHRGRRRLLRRRRPEDLHPALDRGRHPAQGARQRGHRARRPHARPASHRQAGDRRRERLGAGGRARDRAGLRHPDRLRARDVRLVRGSPRLPPRRRRDRPAREHLRSGHGAGDAAHRRADRRRDRPAHATSSGGSSRTTS